MRNGLTLAMAAMLATGCGVGTAGGLVTDSSDVTAADESATVSSALTASVGAGAILKATANLNLRTAPSTGSSIRLVMPAGSQVTAVTGASNGGWYDVKFNGTEGWAFGGYLALVSQGGSSGGASGGSTGGSSSGSSGGSTGGSSGGSTSAGRDGAIARARSGVGFSYWWGHGRWVPGGLSSSTAGVCTGNCPSCSHSGGYGADCSGYVGKVWQVGSNNSDPTVDSHPYSTASFIGSSSQWNTVDRGSVQPADALVYNSNGAGHVFLYESGDGWGSMWAYEAKGCSYGVVHDLRTASSAYKAIHRAGY